MEAYHNRHELGNALTIALANVEGMLDGLVEATPTRLESLAETLRRAIELLGRLDATQS